jgi:predicted ABC-type ATPase
MATKQPTIYVIAGCNGAGKTTFAREFLPNEVKCLRFLNADEIARGISPLKPSAGAVQAALTITCRWRRAGRCSTIAMCRRNRWQIPPRMVLNLCGL